VAVNLSPLILTFPGTCHYCLRILLRRKQFLDAVAARRHFHVALLLAVLLLQGLCC
jgi:hypothetical protein